MTFIQENIKLPYEESSETKKSNPIVIEEESEERYIPKKKTKPIIIEEESEERYIPKKTKKKSD